MSDPQKPPRDAWDLIEDALLEEEAERIAKMSLEQLTEQLRKQGSDPDRARHEMEKALGHALPAVAPSPGNVVSLADARSRRRPRTLLYTGLALAAGAALVVGTQGGRIQAQVDAWLHPVPTEQPSESPQNPVPPTHEPTPKERAAKLREEAYVNVRKGYMGDAADELDEAEELDGDGATAPEVREARKAIVESKPRPYRSKPSVGPWEKALPKRIFR